MADVKRRIYAVQFHPEFKSRPMDCHPLFKGFIKAALTQSAQRRQPAIHRTRRTRMKTYMHAAAMPACSQVKMPYASHSGST